MIRLVVSEGERRGRAVCGCGCTFAWNQRVDLNVLYSMKNGSLVVFIVCPKCNTKISGPTI